MQTMRKRMYVCTQNLQFCAAEEGSHKTMGISKLGCSCWGSLCIVCFLFSSPRRALLSVMFRCLCSVLIGRGFDQFLCTDYLSKHNHMLLCAVNFVNSKYGTTYPNGSLAVDSHLVKHAACNVIGQGRQRLLIATKGVEQKERAPEERRSFSREWKLNTFWRLQLTNSRGYRLYRHVRATTNSWMEKHSNKGSEKLGKEKKKLKRQLERKEK